MPPSSLPLIQPGPEASGNSAIPTIGFQTARGFGNVKPAKMRGGVRDTAHACTKIAVHRRNVQYRQASTALQNHAATSGCSDGAGPSVQRDAIPQSIIDPWDNQMSETMSPDVLEPSFRDSTVFDLTTGLERYLGLRDVAQQGSDDGRGEPSDASSDSSAGSSSLNEDTHPMVVQGVLNARRLETTIRGIHGQRKS
ncbi:hypothetical protein JB92DRAFT_3132709 [Gautieria morchelliformis]|nr:hypothetical protein JB92DRAFT_3132709 [Gautieria morchelliformis]